MEKRKNAIYVSILIYFYLTLPTLIFMIGWLRWYWAFLFGMLMAFACVRGFTDNLLDK